MKQFDKAKLAYISLAVFLAAIFLFLSYSRVFDEFEYSTLDFRYRMRPPQQADREIVIVEIGDDSIDKLGKWPFPRNYHALMTKALKSSGATTVVFDIFFSEDKEGDEAFAQAIRSSGNVYLPYVFELDRESPDRSMVHASGYAAPLIKVLNDAALGTGFINVEPDIDGKVRKIPPFIEYKGIFYPHMTVLAAITNLGFSFDNIRIVPGHEIILDANHKIPLDEDSSMLVNYPAMWGKAFRHYSYVDILQSYLADVTGQQATINLDELKGTICFIGLTATAAPDAHPSPMERLYPGIGVHTSVYNSIINSNYLTRLNRWWNILILAIMWVITAFITNRSRKRFAMLSIVLILASYIVVSSILFYPFNRWVDVFCPLLTIVSAYVIFTFKKYVTESQKREIIEKELDIAKDIQESFLPKEIPHVGGLEVGVNMLTARQVGGDLYDLIQLDDRRLGVMMGDVSGKGVPAALYMARVVSVFKAYAKEGTPAEVVKKVNERLIEEGGSNLFVTLTYMIFDTETRETSFAIGGHLPTVMVDPDGNVELLDVAEGMPLGLIEGGYDEGNKKYRPGTLFILYTDGVTEAMNTRGEMFEVDRLVKLAKNFKGKSPQEVVDAIQKAVADFAGRAKQHDDITVLAIRSERKKFVGDTVR